MLHFRLETALYFYLVHSPLMAQVFKKNLQFPTLLQVCTDTAAFRSEHYLHWSSRFELRRTGAKLFAMAYPSMDEFREELDAIEAGEPKGFVGDLFPSLPNQNPGKGPAAHAGNDFMLLLAENAGAMSASQVNGLIEASWPLFLCLYPANPIEQRNAALARNLITIEAPKACEFSRIKSLPSADEISPLCAGSIEGAHIKPHALGGSDRPENGLWLCQYHHRRTEGKLRGCRDSVSFVCSPDTCGQP